MAVKKSILRASVQNTFLLRNIIKKVLAALKKIHYFNITVTLATDLEEILLSISWMVFQKVNNKSSEVGKKENEKRELPNFREASRDNYLIRYFLNYWPNYCQLLTFSNNIFVYLNIFQRQLSISIISFLVFELGPHVIPFYTTKFYFGVHTTIAEKLFLIRESLLQLFQKCEPQNRIQNFKVQNQMGDFSI